VGCKIRTARCGREGYVRSWRTVYLHANFLQAITMLKSRSKQLVDIRLFHLAIPESVFCPKSSMPSRTNRSHRILHPEIVSILLIASRNSNKHSILHYYSMCRRVRHGNRLLAPQNHSKTPPQQKRSQKRSRVPRKRGHIQTLSHVNLTSSRHRICWCKNKCSSGESLRSNQPPHRGRKPRLRHPLQPPIPHLLQDHPEIPPDAQRMGRGLRKYIQCRERRCYVRGIRRTA
jgi:hypothetical protein